MKVNNKIRNIVYIVSIYPAPSHTFIADEISTLRSLGWNIATVSIEEPQIISENPAYFDEEIKETLYLRRHLGAAFFSNTVLALWCPIAYMQLLRAAISLWWHRPRQKWKAFPYLLITGHLLLWMKRRGYQHIHAHFANVAASVSWLAAQSRLVTYSLSLHGPFDFHKAESENLAIKIEGAEFVRVISHFSYSQCLLHTNLLKRDRIKIFKCGINLPHFPFSTLPAPNNSQRQIRCVCVGRLVPEKGHWVLVEAARNLKNEGIEVQIDLVGAGPLYEDLRKLAQCYGVSENIRFHGAQSRQSVTALMVQAQVFVLPSLAEGLPIVIMEAMALGRMVISTWVNGIPELVHHGKTAIHIPPGDPEALQAAIKTVMSMDTTQYQKMVTSARKRVELEHDITQNAPKLSAAFDQVISLIS